MSTRKVTVNTNPVANHYAGPDEKIIEFSSPGGGGLISFRLTSEHDTLVIDLYRMDDTVTVRAPAHSTMMHAPPDPAKTPGPCPNCHGEREWSGRPGIASCYFCGREGG